MDNFSKELKVAIDAAKEGARIAQSYYRVEETELELSYKLDGSIVTKADKESEDIIKSHILASYPKAEFITEENENTTAGFKDVWIVDPIDGSREFSRGIDLWAVLLARVVDGKVKLGVAYFPELDVLLYAQEGRGAFVNEARIHVSKTEKLDKSFLGFSPFVYFKDKEREILFEVLSNISSARSFNSSFCTYCVSTGRMDLFIANSNNKIWDIAPFLSIIPEAGGKVTDWEGNDLNIKNESAAVVASNGLVHDEVLAIINKRK